MPTEVLALVFDRLTPDARALAYRAALGYTDGNVRADRIVGVFGLDLSIIPYQGYTRDLDAVRKALDAFANRATSQFSGSREDCAAACRRGRPPPAPQRPAPSRQPRAAGPVPGRPRAPWRGPQVEMQMAAMQSRMLQTFETLERDQRGYSTANGLMAVVSSMRNMPGRKSRHLLLRRAVDPAERARSGSSRWSRRRTAPTSASTPWMPPGLRTESTLKEARDELTAASETNLRRNPSRDVNERHDAGARAQRGPPAHGSAQRADSHL